MDDYKKVIKLDLEYSKDYYLKSLVKTEQQKFLESIIDIPQKELYIADIACGAGTLTYHIYEYFKNKNHRYFLLDYVEESIELAKRNLVEGNFEFHVGDMCNMNNVENETFDLMFCWQTLSWITHPKEGLLELIRVLKPGGKLYLSSLFNLDYDVDIFSSLTDHTRSEDVRNIPSAYNTFSEKTISSWLVNSGVRLKFHKFIPTVDFEKVSRGRGTHTVMTEQGRIQISGGLLMNWYVLEITKD
jgi:ubiquinone/menaquinone biosynthesis C-methylase UbiE